MLDPAIVPYLALSIVICLVFSFYPPGPAVIRIAKSINELIHGRTCPRMSSLKIPPDCPKIGPDFIVDLECPDGTVVRVAIPADSNSGEGLCSRVSDTFPGPVGLNLICPGHYN